MNRKKIEFSNPIIKDRIEIKKNSVNKLIFRVFLTPNGGQNRLHYHSKLNETFKIIKGDLKLITDSVEKILISGDHYTITRRSSHMFLNRSERQVIFEVEIINPKQMVNALQIMYGLARDGKMTKKGLPKNIFHLAIGLHMMDAFSPQIPYLIQKAGILLLVLLGKMLGIEKLLILKYCD